MEGGRLVALPTGYKVGRYTLSAVLGEGGFGITYRARDEALRRDVAVKEYLPADVAVRDHDTTIRPRTESDTKLYNWGLQRFVDEARTLAAMSAPNIVAVHDFMETNGTGYMVMELIEGRSLAFILDRDGPLPADRLMPITRQLLSGLEAVHARGYLHRDIKPGNILIRPNGQPVLVDFGAARISRRSGTHAMTSVYTPGYAPAEQYAADGEQGPWTDIYALSATLYESITGWPPPDATTRLLNDRIVPASQAAKGKYPASFLAGIDAGLGLRKENRPLSVAAWRAILFDQPMPEPDATLSATRTDFPTVIAGQRSSKSGAVPTPRASQPGPPPSMRPPSIREPSQRQPSLREQSPSRRSLHDEPPARRARWPLIAGGVAILLLGAGGGLLASGGFGLFDSARTKEANRRAAEDENRRQADLAAEAARRRAEEEAAKTKAAADEAERRRIEEAAARQRAADEEAARARAAEEARRRADEDARRRADEEAARVRADEEMRRKAAAEEAQRRAQEDARRRADEEARARAAEEARRKADADAGHARAVEEARRRAAEEEARRKAAADDPQRRAQEEARRKADEEAARARAAEEARRRAAAEEERRRREEAARKPPPSLHAGDGRWTATASVQTHARGRVCMDSFTITGTATNGVLQASTTYGGPMVIRIGDDGLKAVDIGYNGRPVRTYWGNMRSTLLEFVDGCIYRINWTKQ